MLTLLSVLAAAASAQVVFAPRAAVPMAPAVRVSAPVLAAPALTPMSASLPAGRASLAAPLPAVRLPAAAAPAVVPALLPAPARANAAPAAAALSVLAAPAKPGAAPADTAPGVFDGVGKAAANGAVPAADPALGVRAALADSLRSMVGPLVLGWRTPHVEKPAFPYQVDRQARIYGPQAATQTAENRARVMGALPGLTPALLLDVKSRLGAPAAQAPDLPTQTLFTRLMLQAAASGSVFSTYGTIVNVGWGSGDHVNVNGDVPAGGSTISDRLAAAAERLLADPAYAPLAAWLTSVP